MDTWMHVLTKTSGGSHATTLNSFSNSYFT